jgi:DNA-binding NarL/FixJ family response regulator
MTARGIMPLRLLVVDDHDIVRIGLRSVFGCKDDWQICGEATDGPTALAKVLELAPDVVILDLTLHGMNGFETAIEMRRIAPSTKIVLFSVHYVPATARQVGADAFVSKGSDARELIATIERLTAQTTPPRTPAATAS